MYIVEYLNPRESLSFKKFSSEEEASKFVNNISNRRAFGKVSIHKIEKTTETAQTLRTETSVVCHSV